MTTERRPQQHPTAPPPPQHPPAPISHLALARLCVYAVVNDASPQVAILIDLALVANATGIPGAAAYAAVSGAVAFATGLFNFLVAVTMAQVGRAVGRGDWVDVRLRFRVAVASAVVSACACGALLYAAQDPLWELMALTPEVRRLAVSFFPIRLVQLLPTMLQRVSGGLLGGFQCVRILAFANLLTAIFDVAANYVALYVLRGGLPGAAVGSAIASAIGAVALLLLAVCLVPAGGGGVETAAGAGTGSSSGKRGEARAGGAGEQEVGTEGVTGASSGGVNTCVVSLPVATEASMSMPLLGQPAAETAMVGREWEREYAEDQEVKRRQAGEQVVGDGSGSRGKRRRMGKSVGGGGGKSRGGGGGGGCCGATASCAAAKDYAQASGNMVVRSLLLSASVWSLTLTAGRLGSATLGAHQLVLQLWMLTSLVCDGFADAGTMLGSKMIGAGHQGAFARLCRRLIAYGLCTGLACGLAMYFFQHDIVGLYFGVEGEGGGGRNSTGNGSHGSNGSNGSNSNNSTAGAAAAAERAEARAALNAVWPLLCSMQVLNAAVFVYDGLIYATHSFAYVRNLMLIGTLAIFAPSLACMFHYGHTLLWLWVAKSLLNAWRCGAAVLLIHCRVLGGGGKSGWGVH